jgi:hypothetical protein
MDPHQNQTPINSSPLPPPLNQNVQAPVTKKSNFGKNIILLSGVLVVMVAVLITAITLGKNQVKTDSEAAFRRSRKTQAPLPTVIVPTTLPSPTLIPDEIESIDIENIDNAIQDIKAEMSNL